LKNIISAKFYRATKQKSTLIVFIIAFFASFFTAFSASILYGNKPFFRTILEYCYQSAQNLYIGTQADQIVEILKVFMNGQISDLYDFISLAFSSDSIIFLIIFLYYFVLKDRKDGIYYSVYYQTTAAGRFISNLLVILAFSFVLHLISSIGYVVMSFVAFEGIEFVNLTTYLIYALLKNLLLTLIGMCTICFVDCTPKLKSNFTLSILYVLIFNNFFYEIIDTILQDFMNLNLYGEYGFPIGSYTYLMLNENSSMISSAVVIVLFGALITVLELVVLPKKDQI